MNRRFQRLLQEEADLQAEHARLLAAIESNGGTPEQLARADAIEARTLSLRTELAAERGDRDQRRQARATPLDEPDGDPPDQGRPVTGSQYAELFGLTELDAGGFEDAGDFFSAILHRRGSDPRLMAATSTTLVGSEGGFLVPTEYSSEVLDGSFNDEIVRPRADLYRMSSNERVIAGFDSSDRTAGKSVGGFVGYWLGENATGTRQAAKFRELHLHAHKLAIYHQASMELFEDAPDYGRRLEQGLAAATTDHLDDAYLNGTGAGKPLGILKDSALIAVTKEVGQAADSIVYPNLVNMFARMYNAGRKRAVWVANSNLIPQLLQLTVAVGTGGSVVPVLTESNGEFRILTRPVFFTDLVPTLGDQGDILFVDLSQYAIGMRKELVLEATNAAGWTEGAIDWRAIVRTDGRGKWKSALTPRNGTSQSWAVTLAARA
jgi:HK97 family phage major capsid protein